MADYVALLAEGVDRNSTFSGSGIQPTTSPSSRRAWIEIPFCGLLICDTLTSPSSRRAWIEIYKI